MSVKIENVDKNLVKLEIEVGSEAVEKGLAYSYKKNIKKFHVNGFRPGKVPRNIVERYYGVEALYEDALQQIVPEAFSAAVEENNLDIVSRPEYDVQEISKDKLVFTAQVYTKPEVVLGDYKGVEIQLIPDEVTDEDVERELSSVAERNARMITVEDRPAQMGDTLEIDFDGFIDGEAFEGGSAQGHTLKLGSNQFIPGFEEQLVGVEAGAETTVKVTFPEDYHASEYAGKEAEFKVKVNAIKVKELPVIDDEFASDVSEFETLEEYKNDIRAKLSERKKNEAENAMKNEAVSKAVKNAEIDIPACMIEDAVDDEIRKYADSLRRYGMNYEDYLKHTGSSEEQMREMAKPAAEERVRRSLVVEAISKAEDIQATEEEIDKKLEEYAKYYNRELEEIKAAMANSRSYLEDEVKFDNTIQFLYEHAVKTEKKEEAPAEEASAEKEEQEA